MTVIGEFVMEEWTDQNGSKRSAPVIIVNQLDFGGNQAGGQKPQTQTQQAPARNEPPMDFDYDVPF